MILTDGFGRKDREDRRVGARTGAQGPTNGRDAAASSRLTAQKRVSTSASIHNVR